ncbi:ABC transporter ATP-binding protein [Actinophytocola gossypii]|uniref:ABC transporter ATP-binding protein n=1 Tax=Actinophytocola gossypii TaxID=2812003 RepID=A0ABT2J150_9PSEU|nr:ABC transporter ATP-binding protein [Actinophytocola gossypii]MCT2581578.1 ABC transporter ATP-binding protein [Actinophytocola gossypii]
MTETTDHGTAPELSGEAISVRGVGKTYDAAAGPVRALMPTDLEVRPGEFVVLLGPSGCGKTTLLRMLAGLISPTEGTIEIGGRPLFTGKDNKPARDTLGSLGFVFQAPNLMPWRKVWRNIALPLEAKGIGRAERKRRAVELAELVGLGEFLDHYPKALSGGMQQRVAIARALIHRPSILLMDEPFGALDAMTRDTMNLLLQRLWLDTGKTVVLVTHSISEAVFLADRVVLLSQRPGRVQDVVEVDFERPRDLAVSGDTRFADMVGGLRKQLGGHA